MNADPVRITTSETLHRRALVLRAIRQFFDDRGFVEVDTPLMVRSPGIEEHVEAFAVASRPARYLITSPEFQLKRLLARGMDKIYQLGHCFRDDELGAQHEPEFLMLEWYRTHETFEALMRDTEELISDLSGKTAAFRDSPPQELRGCSVASPWRRIRVSEAFDKFSTATEAELLDDETFYRRYLEDVEPNLGLQQAAFVTHWPARMASLARFDPRDPTVAERFEGYVAGVELCNGFSELTDSEEQRGRFEVTNRKRVQRGAAPLPIDEHFLAALSQMPPAAGNALGVDRLLMLLLDQADIQSVLPFPSRAL